MLSKIRTPFAELLGGPTSSPATLFQRLTGTASRAQLTPSILHVMPHYIDNMVQRVRVVCSAYFGILLHFPDARADEALRCLGAQCDVWERCSSSEKWMTSLFDGENRLLEPHIQTLATLEQDDQRLIAAWDAWLVRTEAEAAHEKSLIDSVISRLKIARRAKKLASPAKRRQPPDSMDNAEQEFALATPEGTPIRDRD